MDDLESDAAVPGHVDARSEFCAIVAKPDNVPIVVLVFLLGVFHVAGDISGGGKRRRMKQGLPPVEKLDNEKVLVWPDLVYTEMICMIALSALLMFWAIWLQAPLEEPASSAKTPNPSKAPWYFLGLQEMLVYYDPWMAGVVLPSLIIFGLMAIPYIDFNKRRQRVLHDQAAEVRLHDVSVWLSCAVGDADRDGHVAARTELEFLRSVRRLGCAQGRSAGEHLSVGRVLA